MSITSTRHLSAVRGRSQNFAFRLDFCDFHELLTNKADLSLCFTLLGSRDCVHWNGVFKHWVQVNVVLSVTTVSWSSYEFLLTLWSLVLIVLLKKIAVILDFCRTFPPLQCCCLWCKLNYTKMWLYFSIVYFTQLPIKQFTKNQTLLNYFDKIYISIQQSCPLAQLKCLSLINL